MKKTILMQKFVHILIKFRWYIALFIPLMTLLFAYALKDAQFDGSYRIWFEAESKTLKQYDAFKASFGNDDSIIIVFSDPNGVMNKKALGVIQRLTEKLWQTKYIARVDSLSNYQYVHVSSENPDDILVENFIKDIEDLTPEQLKEKEKIALTEDLLRDRIISADGTTTMIVGRLVPKAGETFGASKSIKEAVESYLKAEQSSAYTFHLAGGPIVNQTFATLAKYDIKTFTPLVILVAMLLLWAIFRSFTGVVLSLFVVIFTFVIVMSLQVLFGYKFNNFTANMPIFVVAIGIADAMHLFWIYILARHKGYDNHEAIYDSLEKNFLPLMLTSLTTAFGFASLSISAIVPISTLGIATASAAILAFVLTILFIPALLAIINPDIQAKKTQQTHENDESFASRYSAFICQYDKHILRISLLLFGLIGLGVTQLQVDSNAVRYFKESVPFRETVSIIQERLSGPMTYEIAVDSKSVDGIKEPVFMQNVEKFCFEFKNKYPDARHTSSLVDVVKKFNEIVAGTKELPQDKNLIAQYLLLYSLSLPQGMEINDKMDVHERYLRISASMNVVDTSKDLEMIAWIESWWAQTPYSAEVNGQSVMFAYMQSDVTQTLIYSILMALATISLLMLFIFRDIRMLPLFIIPNILPVILLIGVMGWFGIRIDIGVAISGAIILGIAVDDTIHFLLKYKEAREKGLSLQDALTYVMHYAGFAILFTTIVLSCAFGVFIFSQFMLNANFGLITALALSLAVAVDLVLLPAILSRYDGGTKSFLDKNN